MKKFLAFLLLLSCAIATPTVAKKSPPKILVTRLDADEVEQLQQAVPGAKIVAADGEADALTKVRDADALVGTLSPELVRAGKKLRWVHVYSAGVDRYQFPELVDSDITFTNSKVIQGPNVGDQAMALLLVLTRRMHDTLAGQQAKDWRGTRERIRQAPRGPVELDGKTALVVGLGGIGDAIAKRAHGFGMTVKGIKRRVTDPPPHVASIHTGDELHALLPEADVVFIALPLTPETEGLYGAKEFGLMKDGAFLINIARGKIVDTEAMMAAVKSGRLGGVGLDVTDPEPVPPEHPLWTLPDVVITPHMGGTSDGVWARRKDLVRRNAEAFVAGQPLENVVDKKAGY